MYAVGIRKGGEKIRMMIATCGTTLPSGTQEYDGWDEHGERWHKSYATCDIEALWTLAQPAVDVHNKWRQASLAVEKSWQTKSFENRAKGTALGTIAVDAFNHARCLTTQGTKYGKTDLLKFCHVLAYRLVFNCYRSEVFAARVSISNARYAINHTYAPNATATLAACGMGPMLANGWSSPPPTVRQNTTVAVPAAGDNNDGADSDATLTPVPVAVVEARQQHNASSHIIVTYASQAFKNAAWKGGKQQWCAICNQAKTGYYCLLCGPGVPVHSLRSAYKTCLRDHQRDPAFRSPLQRPRSKSGTTRV